MWHKVPGRAMVGLEPWGVSQSQVEKGEHKRFYCCCSRVPVMSVSAYVRFAAVVPLLLLLPCVVRGCFGVQRGTVASLGRHTYICDTRTHTHRQAPSAAVTKGRP